MMQIAQVRGGTLVAIPPQAEPDHWLTECVGFDIADRICKGLAIVDADDRKKGVTGEVLPLVTVRRTRSGEVKDSPVTLLEQRNSRAATRRYE